jgi:hypothetical protein
MVGDAQPSKPFGRLKAMSRIVAIAVAEGQTVASMVGPVLAHVPGQGRARFDVQVSGAGGVSYQVAVAAFSFDFSAQR